MKAMKRIWKSPVCSVCLLLLAGALLLMGTIGAVRAAPLKTSQDYTAEVGLNEIGVTLKENGKAVSSEGEGGKGYVWSGESGGKLLGEMVPKGEELQLGRAYSEALSVENSGSISEFVRVTVRRYWEDAEGEKITTLSPEMIEIEYDTENGWVLDPETDSKTSERTILYYTKGLEPGKETPSFTKSVTISGETVYLVSQEESENEITTTYEYDSATFRVEVRVDAVQTRSDESAIKSAWGKDVSVTGNEISFKEGAAQ